MNVQDLLETGALVVGVASLAAMYRMAWRDSDRPEFLVVRRESRGGWDFVAHNIGRASASHAWFEVVAESRGRVARLENSGGEAPVVPGGQLDVRVIRSAGVTGLGVELAWMDGRLEHRTRLRLPYREAHGSAETLRRAVRHHAPQRWVRQRQPVEDAERGADVDDGPRAVGA